MLLYGIANRPLDAVVEACHNARASAALEPALESGRFRPLSPKRMRDSKSAAAAQQRKLARLDASARLLAASPLSVPASSHAASPRRNG